MSAVIVVLLSVAICFQALAIRHLLTVVRLHTEAIEGLYRSVDGLAYIATGGRIGRSS